MQPVFSPEKVLEIFKKKYNILKPVTLTQINDDLGKKYHGYALFHLDQSITLKGKSRHRKVTPYGILLNKNLQQNVYVLLHEISHCVSPYVERKHKDEWIYMQHERQFYEHLFEIVKIANKQGIYLKQFKSVEQLMKYDKTV